MTSFVRSAIGEQVCPPFWKLFASSCGILAFEASSGIAILSLDENSVIRVCKIRIKGEVNYVIVTLMENSPRMCSCRHSR